MNPCEPIQAKLLQLVYGLLEDEDRTDVLAHLATCADCQGALERAEAQQKLLATAAQGEFPGVQFAPPAQAAEPTRILRRPRQPLAWGRWALAASVVIVFAGGIGLGIYGWQARLGQVADARNKFAQAQTSYQDYRKQNQAEVDRAAREIRAIQEQIQRLTADWDREANDTERTVRQKKVHVTIQGPRSLQAGARNTYRVDMKPQNNAVLKRGPMLVQLIDPASKEVYFKKEIANPGSVQVDLPANLPVKPGVNLALEVKAQYEDGGPIQVSEELPVSVPLYLTHLTTDRPMYRPGETVYFRSLTVERFSLKPAGEDFQVVFRITGPNGAEVYKAEGAARVVGQETKEAIKGPDGKPVRGLAAGQFLLPAHLPGGEYTLSVGDAGNRFPTEQRKFLVNRYQAPRLNKELEFTRKSYGAGETVEARCQVARVEGGAAVAGQPVQAVLQVDGQRQEANLKTDAAGKVLVQFKLPAQIATGEASLSVRFTDGGNTETIVRPVPVIVNKLLVDFYPEGGDLVAGVPNRVYFQVRTPIGKPAELQARIIDGKGKEVAKIQTLGDDKDAAVNQGMGLFTLTPQAGHAYELKITTPIGIEGRYFLPEVKKTGVVLTIPTGVVEDRIEVSLASGGKDRRLMAGAFCRGKLLDSSAVITVKQGETKQVTLRTAPGISGVHRVTVFEIPAGAAEDQLVPVAERLIYRRPVERLDIRVATDKQSYVPGDPVKLTLKTTDEKQAPAPAILLVSVVDLSIVKLADEKTARTMPTHFYLTTEVKKPEDLEYADFLVSDHPKAAAALDLLLGTQGWRRFAEQNPQEFLKKQPQDAQRFLALNGLENQKTEDTTQLALARVDQKFAPKVVELETNLADTDKKRTATINDAQIQLPVKQAQIQTAEQKVQTSAVELADYQRVCVRLGFAGSVLALLFGGVGCLVIGLRRLASGTRSRMPVLATGVSLLIVIVLGSLLGTFYLMGHRGDDALAWLFEPQERVLLAKDVREAPQGQIGNGLNAQGMAVPEVQVAMPDVAEEAKGQGGPPAMAPGMNRPHKLMKKLDEKRPQNVEFERLKFADKDKAGAKPAEPQLAAALQPLPDAQVALRKDMAAKAKQFGGPAAGDIMLDQKAAQFDALREGRAGRAMFRRGLVQRRALLEALRRPFPVREYAHQHQASPDQVRRDFAETLYWHPVLVLADGSGTVNFQLSDAVTRFQVLAMGHTLDGRLGSSTIDFASRLPYSIEPKLPIEVTSSDKLLIPVTLGNDSGQDRTVQLKLISKAVSGDSAAMDSNAQVLVRAGKRARHLFEVRPNILEGDMILSLDGKFDEQTSDRVERKFSVVPEGFPILGAHSDMLEGVGQHEIVLPESWVKGTLKLHAQVFPSTLADLQKGLEAMLREPGGCFEQSSSSNYPNVLILNYLKESEQAKPEIEQRARQLMANGYGRLTSFECIDPQTRKLKQGYEWFGQTAPPHEALTAYGLLQFRDMARVHPVDEEMMERTRKYLLGQRDGKGGFKRNARALDTFGRAPEEITNAYIVWALTDSGNDDVETELAALLKQAADSKDPYFLALVGNSLVNRGKKEAGDVLRRLSDLQQADGHLQGTRTSITGSAGRDLQIETTALCVLAWLKANRPEFNPPVQKAVKWIGQQRGGYGGFGATQSTILALKALIAHTRPNRKTANAGELKLYVNDRPEPVDVLAFPAASQEPLVVRLADQKLLKPGKNRIKLELTGGNAFPSTLTWSYSTLKPANPDKCPVHIETALDRATAVEGDTVRLKVKVENKSGKDQGMAVAIVGLPGGLSLPEDFSQLKELARLRDNDTKPGVISFWEIRGRELVLYWRSLAKDEKIEVNLDLICRIPGEYRGPASRSYLYYNSDLKYWVDPVTMAVAPKD